jgi:hypothetical protein
MADDVNTSLRIPRELYQRLKQAAERNHRSLHNLLLHYARAGVEQDERRQEQEQEQ